MVRGFETAVEKLIRRQPVLAMPLVRQLAGVLARRLAPPQAVAAEP